MKTIDNVDIVYGASWGDEGKGKITHFLASKPNYYNFVCRWNGGSNAGHTIYHNGTKFATHIVPSGIFFGIKSVIGPNCVVNLTTKEGPYTYSEILTILSNSEWTDVNMSIQ